MSFNLSGVVINRCYQDNLECLAEDFGLKILELEEQDFELATESWKETGECDIYFTEKGTLLFLDVETCLKPWFLEGVNVLTFAMSETSMSFSMNYYENSILKRHILDYNGDLKINECSPLPFETTKTSTEEKIWYLLEQLLGKSFWDIEPDEEVLSCEVKMLK